MRTPALLLAVACMCVARVSGQDSAVATHDSTVVARDTGCTYERCALELSKKGLQIFGPHHTLLPLETLLTSGNANVRAEYAAFHSDTKAGVVLTVLGVATGLVQFGMWDAACMSGNTKRESQVFPFIVVPLSFMAATVAEGGSARHHLERAVELYNDDLSRSQWLPR